MRVNYKSQVLIGFLMFCMLVVSPARGVAQQPKSQVASANGEGTITIGREVFALNAVVAKLFEDGAAELNLVADITIFVKARWTASKDAKNSFDLEITGSAANAELTGTGKLVLSDNRKSIVSLKLQAVNELRRRNIDVNFVGK